MHGGNWCGTVRPARDLTHLLRLGPAVTALYQTMPVGKSSECRDVPADQRSRGEGPVLVGGLIRRTEGPGALRCFRNPRPSPRATTKRRLAALSRLASRFKSGEGCGQIGAQNIRQISAFLDEDRRKPQPRDGRADAAESGGGHRKTRERVMPDASRPRATTKASAQTHESSFLPQPSACISRRPRCRSARDIELA